jgi:hypothetical protein
VARAEKLMSESSSTIKEKDRANFKSWQNFNLDILKLFYMSNIINNLPTTLCCLSHDNFVIILITSENILSFICHYITFD